MARPPRKIIPTWVEYSSNKSYEIERLDNDISLLQQQRLYLRIVCLLSLICLIAAFNADRFDADIFLSVNKYNQHVSIASTKSQAMDKNERLEHAKYLVNVLNSLSDKNKDVLLSANEHYFDPQVFKQFIVKQHNVNFFSKITSHSMTYLPILKPGVEIGNRKEYVLYGDSKCYESGINGNSSLAGVDCRYNRVDRRFYETYLFDVERYIAFPDGRKQVQRFKARITFGQVNPEIYSKGFLVSEYTEII